MKNKERATFIAETLNDFLKQEFGETVLFMIMISHDGEIDIPTNIDGEVIETIDYFRNAIIAHKEH